MKPALPYLPHELDRHPDRDRIRATIAEDIAGAVEGAEDGERVAGEVDWLNRTISDAILALDGLTAGMEAGCLAPHEVIAQLRALIDTLQGGDGE